MYLSPKVAKNLGEGPVNNLTYIEFLLVGWLVGWLMLFLWAVVVVVILCGAQCLYRPFPGLFPGIVERKGKERK